MSGNYKFKERKNEVKADTTVTDDNAHRKSKITLGAASSYMDGQTGSQTETEETHIDRQRQSQTETGTETESDNHTKPGGIIAAGEMNTCKT